MKIAVASGKGGTGKTTFALSLAFYASENKEKVVILDCDVEEPNVNLFLKAKIELEDKVTALVPLVNKDVCTGCGKCESICAFSAIVLINGKPLLFPEMCHSCGGCFNVCPVKAISEMKKEVGKVERGKIKKIYYAGGSLKIGEAISVPVIKEVKQIWHGDLTYIYDCPPGTSCPVIESVKGSDCLILVTEPTPFGLNDLKLAVDMARAIYVPFGVIINRSDIGDNKVTEYCKENRIDILAEIPDDRKIAELYSTGDCISYIAEKYHAELGEIHSHIREHYSRGAV